MFRIDLEERQLLRNGRRVQLTPKIFDILLTLVENHGHTVGKNELMDRVWADAFVEEGNLNRNISTLRKLLGEDGARFIKTVPKRGYRFDPEVREIEEHEDSFFVEKRTNYRVSLQDRSETETKGVSLRLKLAGGLVIILVAVISWCVLRPAASDANSVIAAGKQLTANQEALELYNRGRELWRDRSVEGLHQATIDLERAVMLDPEFAQAYAALADAYVFDVIHWKKAEATANEAIRRDPILGQPYATIGFVRMYWEQKLGEADPYFKQAVLVDPTYATGHQWYALNLVARRSGGSALAEIKRAVELEPNSAAINADMCQILYFSRKYDLAVDQCKKTLEIDPNFLAGHQHLYEIYTAKQMYDEAVEEYFKVEELYMTTGTYPEQLEKLRIAYASGGIREFWKERIKILEQPGSAPAYLLGRYYARLGDVQEALRWFKKSAEKKEFDFIFFAADPANHELLIRPQAQALIVDHLGLRPN
ncbi:MAG TPA: winged helix-turn-helix domain-containing protein [Pyrinomonadaceae bacterium]|nr:winged helix-turn-helix domain-containing protein [Acidobacteriota bacterium]HQZ96326.1 winged helix-turn-helix domain-containing protein [Pyrinomonadaceae bacterium]